MSTRRFGGWFSFLLLWAQACLFASNPRVVTSTVLNGQDDVDPATTEIRIEFDQVMRQNSWSFVGAGHEISTKPHFADAKTIVVSVKLDPDHDYAWLLNSDRFKGFGNPAGEAAVPQQLAFHTRAADAPAAASALTPQQNKDAIAALRKAIDEDYSYRDRLKVNWDKLFTKHTPALESAKTANEFGRTVAWLLRDAEDAHVFVRVGERTIGTTVNAKPANFNYLALKDIVQEWTEHEDGVVSGKLGGGIAYLMIPEWTDNVAKVLDASFPLIKDAKGLIIDVRPNGGGDELAAQKFAGRFIDGPKVYSKDRLRSGGKWEGPYDRVVEPRPEADRYAGPVAVLIGGKVASSCESFVLMMKQGKRCKLIGGPTKGSSGRPQEHALGNGVTVFLSSWEDQLPDGTILEGRGVQPDIAVKTTLKQLEQSDPILEAAVKAVGGKPIASTQAAK